MLQDDLLNMENALKRMEDRGFNFTRSYKKLKQKYELIKNGAEYDMKKKMTISIKDKKIDLYDIVIRN